MNFIASIAGFELWPRRETTVRRGIELLRAFEHAGLETGTVAIRAKKQSLQSVKHATKLLLIIAGLINLYPVIGLGSAATLADFYGIPAPGGDLLILMRHRALLFGILGAFIICSAFKRHLQPAAIVAGLVSMLGFNALALSAPEYGDALHKAVVADFVGSAALVAVIAMNWMRRKPG